MERVDGGAGRAVGVHTFGFSLLSVMAARAVPRQRGAAALPRDPRGAADRGSFSRLC